MISFGNAYSVPNQSLFFLFLALSLSRFYGRNSSYVHGGLDSSGKPEEAVYGQAVSITHASSL